MILTSTSRLALWLVLFTYVVNGQSQTTGVSINPTGDNPDPSAILDVNADTKGLLIPRVSLTSTTSASPVTTPQTSLLVYNTATANDVTPGFYFWNGSAWSALAGGGGSDYWSKTGSAIHPTTLGDVVAVGTDTPEATASLEISSTTKGLLIPRMTVAQRDLISSPATGLQIYNLDCGAVDYYNGTCWLSMAAPLAHPGPISSAGSIFCSATSQSFSVSSVLGATDYTWSVPAGTVINSGQGTNSITVTMGDLSGEVCVVASNACASSPQSCLAISVNAQPASPGTISGPITIARGAAPSSYSVSPVVGATSYNWTLPDGGTIETGAGTSSIRASFPCSSPTSGSISVTAQNACGTSGSSVLALTLTPLANAGPPAFGGSTLGGNAAFPTGSGGTGTLTYSWSPLVNLNNYTSANPVAQCTGTTATYTVTATDAIGCTAQSSVVVTRQQTMVVNAGSDVSIGPGEFATLGGNPTAGNANGPFTYSWSPATGLSSTTVANPIANPGETTTYTVNVTGACGTSGSNTVTVTATGTRVEFAYTGTVNVPWVVPDGVTQVKVECWGAEGGGSSQGATGGGLGGYASAIRSVTPGETLYINVGGRGGNGSSVASSAAYSALNTAGFNGGGAGVWGNSTNWSGGGGGASDVRQFGTALANRVVIGGGGGSRSSTSGQTGGDGGFPTGVVGGGTPNAGAGGTQTAGGNAGGGEGVGGAGVYYNTSTVGGSGGGGRFGGGGGGGSSCSPCNRGGGGGSSYYDGVGGVATATGVRTGNGLVVITY